MYESERVPSPHQLNVGQIQLVVLDVHAEARDGGGGGGTLKKLKCRAH